ncbi:hypothetical protein J0H58_38760 [bacterium]|nr:hypothetical protein [bacterium]
MNPPRVTAEDYTHFLLATPKASTCVEAARVQPGGPDPPAHDAFTRLLHRLEPEPAALWAEVAPLIDRAAGVLVVDDTTLDKPHVRKIELVTRHWSGKHRGSSTGSTGLAPCGSTATGHTRPAEREPQPVLPLRLLGFLRRGRGSLRLGN